jgi:CDP-diacylglycerol pyrophosphatase
MNDAISHEAPVFATMPGLRAKPSRRSVFLTLAAFLVGGMSLLVASAAAGGDDGDGLWHVVNDLCLPMQRTLNRPFPCLDVNTQRGFVVLRAPYDQTRLLVVPTRRVRGIESPSLLQDHMPPLWSIGWQERGRVAQAAGKPLNWNDVGMAVNSQPRRTQDQLHIHVDCVDPRLRHALAVKGPHLTSQWSTLDLAPWGDQYRIRSVSAAELDQNLFKLVADQVPGARTDMGQQSIAVVGLPDGQNQQRLALLVNSDAGHAEELLDHSCTILRRQAEVKPGS